MRDSSSSPNKVWITGANGLIGSHLVREGKIVLPGWDLMPVVRPALDLLDRRSVVQAFQRQRPQLIIHCAALSRSPECQTDPAKAREINLAMTQFLADLATDIRFIFFSTDLIFDGQKGSYVETDEPNPLSVYGETKLLAERHVLRNPRHTVVRTSLNAGPSLQGDRGIDEQVLGALSAGKTLNLFHDEFRSPIPAAWTARAVWELAKQGATGVFHVAGAERLSRWQIGELICARFPEFRRQISATSLKAYDGAPRPPDTSLDCGKVQAHLSFPLPRFSEWWRQQTSS